MYIDKKYRSVLTSSTPAVLNCCCLNCSASYWSNPPFNFFIFWHSGALALSPERQSGERVRDLHNVMANRSHSKGLANFSNSMKVSKMTFVIFWKIWICFFWNSKFKFYFLPFVTNKPTACIIAESVNGTIINNGEERIRWVCLSRC